MKPALALCSCATCEALDAQFPMEGRQLALITPDLHSDAPFACLPKRPPVSKLTPAGQAKRVRTGAMPCAGPDQSTPAKLPTKEHLTRRRPMSVTTMTIDALCVSPFNARTNQVDANAVNGMAESLLRRGQIQPLTVHPIKGGRGRKRVYGAIAGGRRYRAFRTLIDAGRLPADHPIDVILLDIEDEGELREFSLAENLVRVDLRPYEIYAAVARAHAEGRSLMEIANTNGQTIETIRRWARLGNLHPTIFAALELGEISQDQAKALGATEDVALQLHIFEKIAAYAPGDWRRSAAEIRKLLRIGDRDLEKMLRFVGEAAYADAGGRYELDMFADDAEQRGRVADEGLLMQLADARLDAIRARVRKQCGRALVFQPAPPRLMIGSYDQGIDTSLEIVAEPQPADAHDAQGLAWLGFWMRRLEDQALAALDDDALDEDIIAHCIAAIDEHMEPLEAELAKLQDRLVLDIPAQSYATLTVQEGGETELRFWWTDRKAKEKAEAAARKLPDAPPPRAVSAGPIARAATPGPDARRSLERSAEAIDGGSGYGERAKADALIRDEHGLTADGVQIMRSLRREMLRAALLNEAFAVGPRNSSVALDYLLWSLMRDRITDGGMITSRAHQRGLAGLAARQEMQPVEAASHLERTQAHRTWKAAVDRLKLHLAVTDKDLVTAFDAFRAEDWQWKQEVAAIVTGCALERSASAGGYEVELHDHVALLAGYHEPERQRTLIEPTEELIALLPRARQLALVHPHVTNGEYLALEKLKASELTGPVTRALKKVADWVHPMLRFRPRMFAIVAREQELETAA